MPEVATKILRKLAYMSREALRFLAYCQKVFRQQQVSLSGGAIDLASLCENYLLVLSTSTKMA